MSQRVRFHHIQDFLGFLILKAPPPGVLPWITIGKLTEKSIRNAMETNTTAANIQETYPNQGLEFCGSRGTNYS